MESSTFVNTTLPTSTPVSEDAINSPVVRTTILAVILLLGFLTNLILTVTIVSSSSLRNVLFHCHIVNLSITHLVTSILILPLVVGYSATGIWDYGEPMCKVAGHLLLSVTIATCLTVLVMNADRVIAINSPSKYLQRVTKCKTVTAILFVWMVAILFPLPLSLGTVPVTNFDHRYICSIDKGSSMDYLISLYSICFALPSITGVLFFVYIAREALSEREAQSIGAQQPSLSSLWPEVQAAGIVFVIFFCWFVTELPFIALTSIHQYTYSDALTESDSQQEFSPPVLLDTAFVWLKFCDAFLSPLVVFKLRKEIWVHLRDLMLCRKSNSVIDSSPRQDKSEPKRKPNGSNNSQPNNASYNPKSAAPFKVPTIRATRDGLHIQGDGESESSIFYADMDLTGKSAELGVPMRTQTDIEMLPDLESYEMTSRVDRAGDVDDDTSDYDTDPYSRSDPVSVRSAKGRINHSYSRSEDGHGFRTKANSLSHDSGLNAGHVNSAQTRPGLYFPAVTVVTGNGSTSSSVNKKKKKRKTAENALAMEEYPDQHVSHKYLTNHEDDGPQPYLETNIDRDIDLEPSPEPKPRRGRKHSEISKEVWDAPEEAIDNVNCESQPVKRKKKKKRNKNIVDAETNTTQTVSVLELIERQIPPPRLEPLPHSVITPISTPPLRSKYPRDIPNLPPSGGSALKKKHRSARIEQPTSAEEHPSAVTVAFESTDSQRKKKKSRPRKTSGDSNKPLMSSNTSSEMHSVVNESNRTESHF